MKTPTEKLIELVMPFLVREKVIAEGQVLEKEWLSKAIETLKERAKTLVELAHSLRFYIAEDIEYEEKAKAKFLNEKTLPYLLDVKEALKVLDTFAAPEIEKIFTTLVEKHTTKLGNIAQPVRVAITGKTESPGIFEVLEIVGKKKTLKRLEKAIKTIG
jgi:glutamyl-tRNA synthetase